MFAVIKCLDRVAIMVTQMLTEVVLFSELRM